MSLGDGVSISIFQLERLLFLLSHCCFPSLISLLHLFLSGRNSMRSIITALSSLCRILPTERSVINVRAVICLMLALQWGGTEYAWNSSRIIGLFVGFGVMILIFIFIQWKRGDKATLPLSVLKQRTVASAGLFMFFSGASIFVLIYYSTPLLSESI